MGLLEGKVGLITGGGRGQGRAHAVRSAEEGADIIILDAPGEIESLPYPRGDVGDLEQTVKAVEALDRRIIAVEGDVRSQESIDSAVAQGIAEFGKIDFLNANAGIWTMAPFWELTETQWEEMMQINLTGVWRSAKAVAPHMIERNSGSIVITSSTNGIEGGFNFAHYAAAKHGVVGLMRSIALELGPHGVRANTVHPGAINTPMTDNQMAWDMFNGGPGGTKEVRDAGGDSFNIMRNTGWLPPEAIANGAVFLNSDLAANITGVSLPIDAGHLLINGVNLNPVIE